MTSFSTSFPRRLCAAAYIVVISLVLTPAALAQAQTQKTLSAEDLAEIHNLYAQYNLMLDAGDSGSWADTFTDDGSFNVFEGRQALVDFADGFIADNPNTRHWNSNIQIKAGADGATGTAYLMLWKVSTQPAQVVLTGIYTDELVRTSEGWRFKSRVIEIDPTGNQ